MKIELEIEDDDLKYLNEKLDRSGEILLDRCTKSFKDTEICNRLWSLGILHLKHSNLSDSESNPIYRLTCLGQYIYQISHPKIKLV